MSIERMPMQFVILAKIAGSSPATDTTLQQKSVIHDRHCGQNQMSILHGFYFIVQINSEKCMWTTYKVWKTCYVIGYYR
jgi:hypothetical protein